MNIKNAILFVAGVLFLGGCGASDKDHAPQSKPNILFIMTDNQAASLIGAYGNPDIQTPHIDALAKSGMRFDNFFAVNGMCSPTRATLMTGLMPSQHGVHNWLDDEEMVNWPRNWSAVAEYRTLPLTLKENGYQTALIGKWHLGQPWEASIGYEHWLTFTVGHTVDFWNNTIVENGEVYDVKDKHVVEFFTDKAIDYIQAYEKGSQPFYLQLNLDGPYVNPPTNMGPARNRFYEQYENADLASFPREDLHPNQIKQLEQFIAEGREDAFMAHILKAVKKMHDDQATRANIASQNTLVDHQVGRVLEALEEKGLLDNTLIIFTSDQGNFYGQHGLWTHTVITDPANLYEAALKVPLIISHKGVIPSGENDSLLGQYDLPVTILRHMGIKTDFENSPGQSFAKQLAGKPQNQNNFVFYEQEEIRGIRSQNYAYWKYLKAEAKPRLFDMVRDPDQKINLADDPAYQETMTILDQELERFFSKYVASEYDLWNGGIAKGSVVRPERFKKLYGNDWAPEATIKPVFPGSP